LGDTSQLIITIAEGIPLESKLNLFPTAIVIYEAVYSLGDRYPRININYKDHFISIFILLRNLRSNSTASHLGLDLQMYKFLALISIFLSTHLLANAAAATIPTFPAVWDPNFPLNRCVDFCAFLR